MGRKKKGNSVMQPGTGLFTRRVTLVDTAEIAGSPVAGNGFQTILLNANGFATRDTQSSGYRVP